MKKNKRSAIEVSTLVLYIVLIASALTLMGGVTYYVFLAKKEVGKKACEWDITKAYYSKLVPQGLVRGGSIFGLDNCRRDKLGDLVVKYEDVVDGGVINQNRAHKKIAEGMLECWNMVGAGDKDPFSNYEEMDNSYCLVCHPIKFDDELINFMIKGNKKLSEIAEKEDRSITKDELGRYNILSINNYLATEKISKKGPTYAEYFYKTKDTSLTQDNIKRVMEKENIEGSAILFPDSIIFIRMYKYKGKSMFKIMAGTLASGVLIVGGLGVIAVTGFTGIGAGVGAAMVKVGLSVGAIAVGAVILVPTVQEAWDACVPECNALGGVGIIPQELGLNEEVPINIDGEIESKKVCDIVVN